MLNIAETVRDLSATAELFVRSYTEIVQTLPNFVETVLFGLSV